MGQVHKCSARKQPYPNASKGACTQYDEIFTQPYPNVIEVSNESQLMSVPYYGPLDFDTSYEIKNTAAMVLANIFAHFWSVQVSNDSPNLRDGFKILT